MDAQRRLLLLAAARLSAAFAVPHWTSSATMLPMRASWDWMTCVM
jgi:hypothetical protein